MLPFEDSHTFASHTYAGVEHPYGVLNTRPSGGDSLRMVFFQGVKPLLYFQFNIISFYAININLCAVCQHLITADEKLGWPAFPSLSWWDGFAVRGFPLKAAKSLQLV
jgi:hypothetical protein